jgi:competence protein ComEC
MVRLAGSHLDAAVIMIPHHGSRTSSTEELIKTVGPQIGVVSCGWQNRFGFPHAEVLQRYRQRHVRIYQTDSDGAVELMTDGRLLKVIPWSDKGWW